MCRYTTTNLTTTECALFRAGGVAHQYTKWIYWLCRDSHNGQPCSNKKPKEDQIGNDFGSRHGPCPVCENVRVAEERYKLAVQRATEIYNATVKRAYDAHLAELEDANNNVETVSADLSECWGIGLMKM
jgi:hypothetical protein